MPRRSPPLERRRVLVWASVAVSFAAVAGVWGVSLRARFHRVDPRATDRTVDAAYETFRNTAREFESRFSALRSSNTSAPAATSTPDAAAIDALKQRLMKGDTEKQR